MRLSRSMLMDEAQRERSISAPKGRAVTRRPGELPEPEEELLGIERLTPEQEEEAERERKQKEEVRLAFLRQLLQNAQFREWLMGKLVGFNTFGNTFAAGMTGFPDQNATWFHAGMKAAGWALWEEFDDAAPDLASIMRREAKPRPQGV